MVVCGGSKRTHRKERGVWSICCIVDSSRNTHGINLTVVHGGSNELTEKRGESGPSVALWIVVEILTE